MSKPRVELDISPDGQVDGRPSKEQKIDPIFFSLLEIVQTLSRIIEVPPVTFNNRRNGACIQLIDRLFTKWVHLDLIQLEPQKDHPKFGDSVNHVWLRDEMIESTEKSLSRSFLAAELAAEYPSAAAKQLPPLPIGS